MGKFCLKLALKKIAKKNQFEWAPIRHEILSAKKDNYQIVLIRKTNSELINALKAV